MSVPLSTHNQIWQTIAAGIRPDRVQLASEWADENRILPAKASAEPGRWRTERTPFLREIMDTLSTIGQPEFVVFMKGTQIGGTEVGLNWIGSTICNAPGPFLVVMPNDKVVERVSKQRLAPMIEETPALKALVASPRSRDSSNTMEMKEFKGGILIITGSNSPAGLASMPIRYIDFDEVDRFAIDSGGEGDPIQLAEKRTSTFAGRRKIYINSTPTVKGRSRIEFAFNASDQRRYYVPCPHCGNKDWIRWANIRWEPDKPETAHLHCEACGKAIGEGNKTEMLAKGEWRATAPFNGKVAGFHLSSLYSPLGWKSWESIVREFLDAKGDPVKLKTFVNTILGETWEEAGEKADDQILMDRREDYGVEVPPGVAVITCGVDVQDNRIECEVVGWGRGEESWGLGYFVIMGDPDQQSAWNDLEKNILQRVWIGGGNVPLRVSATMIDTGGHRAQAVYNFVRPREGRRIYASKGATDAAAPVVKRPAKSKNKGNVTLWMIGTNAIKDALLARMTRQDPGPGYLHFPLHYNDSYFRQLTSEQRVTSKTKGSVKSRWEKTPGARNEALDCRVGAFAALYVLIGMGVSLDREADRVERGAQAQGKPGGRRVRTPGVRI